jgi:GH15 family glucan-1,4-alpha-glucosidase
MTSGAENLQIMYGLRGEVELSEAEINHLDGYKGSRPVRIGKAAAGQRQLDIYGDLIPGSHL